MATAFHKLFIKPVFACTLVALSTFAVAESQLELIDARQEAQISTTFASSPYLHANDIKVQVHEGKVTLTGKVDESVNKDLAKEIALGVSGIKSVDNQIIVQADYNPKTSTRGYADVIEDATITTGIKARLLWSKYSYSDTNTVETKNGRVTFTGAADSSDAKDFAGRLAMGTRGVVSVENNLVVNANLNSVDKGNDTLHNVADGWITTKVKSNFIYSKNVASSDIEVNTSSGVVTLKGKVSSGVERALAVELAQNVRGVKSVEAKDLVF